MTSNEAVERMRYERTCRRARWHRAVLENLPGKTNDGLRRKLRARGARVLDGVALSSALTRERLMDEWAYTYRRTAALEQHGDGDVTLTYGDPEDGSLVRRELYIRGQNGSGHVFEGDRQVCYGLGFRGDTLWASEKTLASVILRECRLAEDAEDFEEDKERRIAAKG